MAYKKTRAVPWSVWPWGKRKMRPQWFEELGRRPFIFRELESTGIYFRGAGELSPDSSVGRASPFRAGGCGFESRPHNTKGVINVTSSSLADAPTKGVVLGRYSKAGKYLLKDIVMSQ